MNKKGFFFTLLVLAFVSLVLLSSIFYFEIENRKSIQKRVGTLNSFLISVEDDINRQLYISGFRIIFLFEKHIADTGDYMTNANGSFQEVFYNGTLYQQQQDADIVSGITFSQIQDSLRSKAAKLNANISLEDPEIILTQEDPWNIKVILNYNLSLEDVGGLVSWDYIIQTNATIPVGNFNDPVYLVETNGLLNRKIAKSNFTVFTQGSDVSNLTSHLNSHLYIAHEDAPSFLQRLEGDRSANVNGIESFVHFGELSQQGISVQDKSIVDYIYFSSNNPASHGISGMPSWFRLDDAHLNVYNVSGLTI